MSNEFKVECGACGGTGLYKGFAEPPETAVVCARCGGTGQGSGTKPFTGRKRKPGIKWVMADGGLWMCRTGNEPRIPVEQFYNS
jgi:hypothetical protein